MAGEDKNDRYRAGKVDQELKNINGTLKRFEKKLDSNIEWQRSVDGRLAAGVERFKSQEEKSENNRKNIIRVGSINLTLGAIGAYIAAKLGMNGG